jgi:hypothetical protein
MQEVREQMEECRIYQMGEQCQGTQMPKSNLEGSGQGVTLLQSNAILTKGLTEKDLMSRKRRSKRMAMHLENSAGNEG